METKTLPAGTTQYRGYNIKEVFKYHLGKSDFIVWHEDDEQASMYPRTCIQDIHADIDEKLSEN